MTGYLPASMLIIVFFGCGPGGTKFFNNGASGKKIAVSADSTIAPADLDPLAADRTQIPQEIADITDTLSFSWSLKTKSLDDFDIIESSRGLVTSTKKFDVNYTPARVNRRYAGTLQLSKIRKVAGVPFTSRRRVLNPGKLDVVVVVDNSSSMSDGQAKLAAAIPALVDAMSDIDWRILVTNTDINDSCVHATIEKNANDTIAKLRSAILIGIEGSDKEVPIQRLLDIIQIADKDYCPDVEIRADANIAHIFLTNEGECSNGSDCPKRFSGETIKGQGSKIYSGYRKLYLSESAIMGMAIACKAEPCIDGGSAFRQKFSLSRVNDIYSETYDEFLREFVADVVERANEIKFYLGSIDRNSDCQIQLVQPAETVDVACDISGTESHLKLPVSSTAAYPYDVVFDAQMSGSPATDSWQVDEFKTGFVLEKMVADFVVTNPRIVTLTENEWDFDPATSTVTLTAAFKAKYGSTIPGGSYHLVTQKDNSGPADLEITVPEAINKETLKVYCTSAGEERIELTKDDFTYDSDTNKIKSTMDLKPGANDFSATFEKPNDPILIHDFSLPTDAKLQGLFDTKTNDPIDFNLDSQRRVVITKKDFIPREVQLRWTKTREEPVLTFPKGLQSQVEDLKSLLSEQCGENSTVTVDEQSQVFLSECENDNVGIHYQAVVEHREFVLNSPSTFVDPEAQIWRATANGEPIEFSRIGWVFNIPNAPLFETISIEMMEMIK